MFMFYETGIFRSPENELNIDNFSKIAHKIAKSKCFVDIQNKSDSPINSLSNDIWSVGVNFVIKKIIGGRETALTTSITYSATVCILEVLTLRLSRGQNAPLPLSGFP